MLESALTLKNVQAKNKIAVKTVVSVGLIALAVALPQFVHMALGQPGGVKYLPMYLPVLIGGCLLGARWGLAVGLMSPVVSFAVTSLMGEAMPAAVRLPFMAVELVVFALVSGLWSKKIAQNGLWAFPAVITAQAAGRAVFLASIALFGGNTPFTIEMIRGQIQTGFIGLGIQAIVVPFIIIILRRVLMGGRTDD